MMWAHPKLQHSLHQAAAIAAPCMQQSAHPMQQLACSSWHAANGMQHLLDGCQLGHCGAPVQAMLSFRYTFQRPAVVVSTLAASLSTLLFL
jgi:hypothetical protein